MAELRTYNIRARKVRGITPRRPKEEFSVRAKALLHKAR